MDKKLTCFSILMLTACANSVPPVQPEIQMPQQWHGSASTAAEAPKEWWKNFGSDELNNLVATALKNNDDVQIALARLEQARASEKIAGANLWPHLDVSGNATRNDANNKKPDRSYSGEASLSYEVDLFGRNRAAASAAHSRAEASGFDRQAAGIMVASNIASTYFELLTLKDRLAIADSNLADSSEILKIIEARFNAGSASQLELSEQRAQLANAKAAKATLENQLAAARNALAVLLARTPEGFDVTASGIGDIKIPAIEPEQPAALISQRPDIKSAEANLAAAGADVSAAEAAFYPSLSISANAAMLASPSGAASTIAAAILAPIFEGGSLEGGLELSQAKQKELAYSYRKTVLTAFAEVEDALVAIKSSGERGEYIKTAADESGTAYNLAKSRYDAGAVDFQTMLTAEQAKLQADDNMASSRFEQLSASLQLYKALGGGTDGDERSED